MKISRRDSLSTTLFDREVVSEVELPNVDMGGVVGRYKFKYNAYGELAKVTLPTGGGFEYDWAAGAETAAGGVLAGPYLGVAVPGGPFNQVMGIYRRVTEKRTLVASGQIEGKVRFLDNPNPQTYQNLITVEHRGPGMPGELLALDKHYFSGDPASGLLFGGGALGEPTAVDVSGGVEGREYKTESLQTDGSEATLRRVDQTIDPRRFRWSPHVNIVDGSPVPNDTRTIETKTTLDDGKVSKQTSIDPNDATGKTIGFDRYNNQTDVWEYDFGQGSAGALIRHTHTDFVRRKPDPDGPNVAENYQDDAFIHIRNLPSRVRVYAAGDEVNPRSETKLVYDNYTAGMTDRPNITGHAGSYDASRIRRGNPTKTTQRLLPNTDVSTTMQYDIAGNVVSVTDARGKTTNIDYSDRFGFPDGEARANNQNPSEIAGQSTYAFATSGTNPLGHTVYSQFDYYTGTPVNTEDANGVITKGFYSDLLGRPTLVVSAVGIGSLERQTSFTYDDSGRTITTRSDQAFSGDGVLTSTIAYDGLGRTIETRTSDPQGTVFTNQEFDAMGRAKRSFNPHRSTSDETYGYTDTVYDALGRVVQIQTFGGVPPGSSTGAVVTTHLGNTTTVRDQANKQRRSVTDAIGRLKSVDEMQEYPARPSTRLQTMTMTCWATSSMSPREASTGTSCTTRYRG